MLTTPGRAALRSLTRRRSLLVRVSALVIATLLGVFVGARIVDGRGEDEVRATPGFAADLDNPVMRLFDPNEPLMPTGQLTTIDEAEARFGALIYLPESVPGEHAPEIWYSPATREIAVRYGTDLVMTFDSWEPGQDPATEYAQQASDWHAGKTAVIAAHPGWIIPADAHAPNEPPVPVVHVSIGGWDIAFFGQMPVDDLVSVAASLAPTHEVSAVPGGSA
jgi:hypothetical protein